MKDLINILHDEHLTLVVRSSDGTVRRFTQRGVKDLLSLLQTAPEVLRDATVADKAVGKAAASCMIMGGVKRVHADVLSEPALTLLQAHGVETEYDLLTDHIINRTGDDWCPLERLSFHETDPAVIIDKIRDFFVSSRNQQ